MPIISYLYYMGIYRRFCLHSFLIYIYHFTYEIYHIVILDLQRRIKFCKSPERMIIVENWVIKWLYIHFLLSKFLSSSINVAYFKSKPSLELLQWATTEFNLLLCKIYMFCVHIRFYLNSLRFIRGTSCWIYYRY